MDAFNRQAWTTIRTLYHDDARIISVAGGPQPLGPDETIAAMRRASSGIVFSIAFGTPEAIDDHAVIVSGTLERRTPTGNTITRRVWLLVFRDGLLYRMRACHNRAEARGEYDSHGSNLGF
jgi:hypothetical protein